MMFVLELAELLTSSLVMVAKHGVIRTFVRLMEHQYIQRLATLASTTQFLIG